MANPNPTPVSNRRGRPKGRPNKTTVVVKDAILAVYEKRGGHRAFLRFADEYPVEFYKLFGRLLPTEIKGDINVSGLDAIAQRLQQAREREK